MALKFLNKKGWHTGSLRNIENVWKAEQKHEAEQKKLEELRKQIHEERERAEFRQLQEQAGLIPKQERLDFLYESGLAVGKGSSGFKALESLPKNDPETTAPSSSNAVAASASAAKQQSVPGALFEEKPQSANEAWRKLHSDPLLLIRQKEQEALAHIKNNPVQMAMIRKSAEAKKKDKDEKKQRTKHHKKTSKHRKRSSSENDSDSEDTAFKVKKQSGSHHRGSKSEKPSRKVPWSSDEELSEKDARRKRDYDKYKEAKPVDHSDGKNYKSDVGQKKRSQYESQGQEYSSERPVNSRYDKQSHYNEYKAGRRDGHPDPKLDKSDGELKREKSHYDSERKEYALERQSESHKDKQSHFSSSQKPPRHGSSNRHQNPVKLSEEERAARLREMQTDAERHEEQRWKRLKRAADTDAQEAVHDRASLGRNFLDAAHKSIYGAEKGGSSTIEESVRRRTHYSQGKSDTETNAFRRQ